MPPYDPGVSSVSTCRSCGHSSISHERGVGQCHGKLDYFTGPDGPAQIVCGCPHFATRAHRTPQMSLAPEGRVAVYLTRAELLAARDCIAQARRTAQMSDAMSETVAGLRDMIICGLGSHARDNYEDSPHGRST